jgi:hypothetical protein
MPESPSYYNPYESIPAYPSPSGTYSSAGYPAGPTVLVSSRIPGASTAIASQSTFPPVISPYIEPITISASNRVQTSVPLVMLILLIAFATYF